MTSEEGEPLLLQGLRFSFAQVRSFVTLASTGSFTRAAQALHLSQPALTTRIRQLEEALELRLFDRTARSVVLTEAGRELLPAFLRLVNDLESAVVSAREHVNRADSTIRLACLPSCAAALLPDAIRRFKDQRPQAAFVVEDALNTQVHDLVRQGKVDFGICVEGDASPDAICEPLLQDQLLAVCAAGDPLASAPRIDVAELSRHALILTQRSSSLRSIVETAFAAHGAALTPAYEVNYMSSAVALVQAGLGVAILPSTASETQAPGVVSRGIEDLGFARTLVLLRRRSVPLRKVAEAFVQVLRASASA